MEEYHSALERFREKNKECIEKQLEYGEYNNTCDLICFREEKWDSIIMTKRKENMLPCTYNMLFHVCTETAAQYIVVNYHVKNTVVSKGST